MPRKKGRGKKLAVQEGRKQRKSRKGVFIIIILLIVLLLVIIPILLFQLNIIGNPLKNLNSKPQLFVIKDECSLIVGKLIHNIKDEGSCQLICRSNCEVRSLNFYNSEFKEIEKDCNECNCYCKYGGFW